METLRRYLRLAVTPTKSWWNLIAGFGVTASGALLWLYHNAVAGWYLILIGALTLSVVAGWRLQRQVDDLRVKRGVIDALSRRLDIGRYHVDSIRWEGVEYQREFDEFVKTRPDQDTARKWLEERPHKAIADTQEWAADTRRSLSNDLGAPYAARFDNDAGLTAAAPPDSLTDRYYIDVWQDHDRRLQRLHQIIDELTQKWL
jgi:hypothetical protein